jgi:hypothetical protein
MTCSTPFLPPDLTSTKDLPDFAATHWHSDCSKGYISGKRCVHLEIFKQSHDTYSTRHRCRGFEARCELSLELWFREAVNYIACQGQLDYVMIISYLAMYI